MVVPPTKINVTPKNTIGTSFFSNIKELHTKGGGGGVGVGGITIGTSFFFVWGHHHGHHLPFCIKNCSPIGWGWVRHHWHQLLFN